MFRINAYPIKNCLRDLKGRLLGEELMPVEVWDLCRVVSDGHLVQKPTSRIRWSLIFLDITPLRLTLWGFSEAQLGGIWKGQPQHSWCLDPAAWWEVRVGHLAPTGFGSAQRLLAQLYGLKTFLVMSPPLAAPGAKLESLLTVDLTVPRQPNLFRFSPLHEHGFLELELNR